MQNLAVFFKQRFAALAACRERMTDEEIRTCLDVMDRKGQKGAPHPFFA